MKNDQTVSRVEPKRMRLVSREILDVNPLNRNSRHGRYSLIFSRKEKRGLVTTGVGVANQREDTCRFGEYETPRRNWVYFFNCGNVSVGQSYQITIVILWWPVSNDTGYGKKRLNRENPHPSCSRSRRINDYPKLKLY